jgi:hypothetical protein
MRFNSRLKIWAEKTFIRPYQFYSKMFATDGRTPIGRMRMIAAEDTARFMLDEMQSALVLQHRFEVLAHALRNISAEGLIAEFGVHKGDSIEFIAERVRPRMVYGFDSFQGLGVDWAGTHMPAAHFSLKGHLPKVSRNVKLVPGWFHETLPGWLETNPGNFALLHIDCDTYDGTKAIFDAAGPRIVPGTIIVFDEHHGYPGWRNGEYQAFNEMLVARGLKRTYIGFSDAGAAVRIT